MEQTEKRLKFCPAGIVMIVYGVLTLLFNLGDLRYFGYMSFARKISALSPILFIILGIVLLRKNKIVNACLWAVSAIPIILYIVHYVNSIIGEDDIVYKQYLIILLIVEVFTLVAVFFLILASLKVGQEGFSWQADRIFVLVAGVVSILSLFLYLESTKGYDGEYGYVLRFGILVRSHRVWYVIKYILPNIIYIAGQILFINWAENPYENRVYATVNGAGETVQYEIGDAYREIVPHVLLLLVTCGIYQLYWIYKATEYTNRIRQDEQRSAAAQVLLCMFIPFYAIYWVYKTAQIIDETARQQGMMSDLTSICTILAFFIGIVPPILLQDKINAMEKNPNRSNS